jgi:hypothetical protein
MTITVSNWLEIPMKPFPQRLTVSFNGIEYILTLYYIDCTEGGWIMDIEDANGADLVCGIPLVTGANLLDQYDYLNFGVVLITSTDGAFLETPTYDNLGTVSHLWLGIA